MNKFYFSLPFFCGGRPFWGAAGLVGRARSARSLSLSLCGRGCSWWRGLALWSWFLVRCRPGARGRLSIASLRPSLFFVAGGFGLASDGAGHARYSRVPVTRPSLSLRVVLRAPKCPPFLGARFARPSLCCCSISRGSLRSPLALLLFPFSGLASLAPRSAAAE